MGVKQQDVRMHLNGKVDQAVITMMCAIVEEQKVMKQQIFQLAQQHDKLMDIISNMTTVAENMKKATDHLRGMDGQGNVNLMSEG